MCIYHPPNYINLCTFFDKITLSLNKVALRFENFIVKGDFNFDINTSGPGKNKLDEFCNLFYLFDFAREATCCTNNHRSATDLILTNRSDTFQKNLYNRTGISDYHKCISTFFKLHYSKLKPKMIHYRNCKNFDESLSLNDLEKTAFLTKSNCPNENYQHLTNKFYFGS